MSEGVLYVSYGDIAGHLRDEERGFDGSFNQ